MATKSLDLRTAREMVGLSQFAAARLARIPRMRLSLAECGEIHLSREEEIGLRRTIMREIEKRAAILAQLQSALLEVGEMV
jgi:hypothetical protein